MISRSFEFIAIAVNGSRTFSNLLKFSSNWKLRDLK